MGLEEGSEAESSGQKGLRGQRLRDECAAREDWRLWEAGRGATLERLDPEKEMGTPAGVGGCRVK